MKLHALIVFAAMACLQAGCNTVFSLNPVIERDEIQAAPGLVGDWVSAEAYEKGDYDDNDVFVVFPAVDDGAHELRNATSRNTEPDQFEERSFIELTPLGEMHIGHIAPRSPQPAEGKPRTPSYFPLLLALNEEETELSLWILDSRALRELAGFNDDEETDSLLNALFGTSEDEDILDDKKDSTAPQEAVEHESSVIDLSKLPINCVVMDNQLIISAETDELRQFLIQADNPYVIGPATMTRLRSDADKP